MCQIRMHIVIGVIIYNIIYLCKSKHQNVIIGQICSQNRIMFWNLKKQNKIIMKKGKIKEGLEFSIDGADVYKVTHIVSDNSFLAIYVGSYLLKEMTTYRGFIKEGDFTLDQVLFEMAPDQDRIRLAHSATGVFKFNDSTQEYKDAIASSKNLVTNNK